MAPNLRKVDAGVTGQRVSNFRRHRGRCGRNGRDGWRKVRRTVRRCEAMPRIVLRSGAHHAQQVGLAGPSRPQGSIEVSSSARSPDSPPPAPDPRARHLLEHVDQARLRMHYSWRSMPKATHLLLVAMTGCTGPPPATTLQQTPVVPPPKTATALAAPTPSAPSPTQHDECWFLHDCHTKGLCSSDGNRCVARTDDDCTGSVGCIGTGACKPYDGRCVTPAATPADCAKGCDLGGMCGVADGHCVADDVARCPGHDVGGNPMVIVDGECTRTPESCDAMCEGTGRCYFNTDSQVCVKPPDKPEDCADECSNIGRCTPRDGQCVVADQADCDKAACEDNGACKYHNGVCLVTDEGCRKTTVCRIWGACHALRGECVSLSDEDCKASEVCKADLHCTLKKGRCAPAY
jgi:hypothetical protein